MTYDPYNPMEVKHEYALETTTALPNQRFDAIVLGGTCILDLDLTSAK
jgi:UDP-N-acetyl-D-galactosamine dehydrogenase